MAVCMVLIYQCRLYKMKIACLRQFQNSINDSVKPLLEEIIYMWGLETEFTITNNSITHTGTGSTFMFKGLDRNVRSIKGLQDISVAFIEEAELITDEAWAILLPTIRKKGSEIWICYNPFLPTDATDLRFYGDKRPTNQILIENNYLDNPFISDEIVADAEHMRIHYPDEYAHYYLGAYAPSLDDTLIPLSTAQECYHRAPGKRLITLPIVAGLDVSRGTRDKNAIVVRQGATILHWREWHSQDMVDTCNVFAEACIKYSVTNAVVDATNLGGGGVVDIWKRIPTVSKIKLTEFMGGHTPSNAKYKNARSETWDLMYQHMCQDLALLDMPWAIKELPTVKKKHDLSGRLMLESKADMMSRGVISPNVGDALSMTYSPRIHQASGQKKSFEDLVDDY